MSNSSFDSIIVGAGTAGLCCAGELLRLGQRPLLVCETKEVAAIFAVTEMSGNNRAFLQHTVWQLGWNGGWWYNLARALNVPLRMYEGMALEVKLRGSDNVVEIAQCASASAFTQMLMEAFPFPIDAGGKDLERVLEAALAIPYEELITMQHIRLSDWLAEQGAEAITTALVLTLGGFTHDMTIQAAAQHLSVFGGIGVLRLLLCGEGRLPIIYPNPREGLCIPLARAIEERGGVVARGKKVAQVVIDGGRATGVRLEDGTFLEAPTVAIATGNPRIPQILHPLPPELEEPIGYTTGLTVQDFNLYFLLKEKVVDHDKALRCQFDSETGSIYHYVWSISGVAPWTAEPGKQIIGSHIAYPVAEVEAAGGPDAIYAQLKERTYAEYPGFEAAVEEIATHRNRHHWMGQVCVGPKVPHQIESVPGLYFVGDGSDLCQGIWTEAAASCGILGARAIAAARPS